ncbi:hypothetical protein [Sphingobacterium endophyticum]|uniref:hypothetical protein n=1 Tax=Sphingobacterium endophyticum TaxID=2546448 RepID=UPI0012E2C50E|nr:hypothetical protein [Sphingobacterium endophyticum]
MLNKKHSHENWGHMTGNPGCISPEYTHTTEIKLCWKKSIGIWVDKNEFSGLVLTHKSVNYLKVIEQDKNSTFDDYAYLGEITFSSSTLREMNDCIIPKSKPDEKDDILYLFENGVRIRIHCGQIKLNFQI